ncbi:hypothetical protein [Bacteroides sp.]|uniref:hypothetical protein n=1 Tax=Bacteroides sp. TaxID=29523 RepID=UPI0025C67083|nr:hypothetical protein [Bacteroides sp.]
MRKILFCSILFSMMFISCKQTSQNSNSVNEDIQLIEKGEVIAGINLTVSEGKRLIAKGILNTPRIREKLENGMIIITRGTTNTYIAEELANLSSPHGSFLTGHFVPEGAQRVGKDVEQKKEIVLENGKVVDLSYEDALKKLKKGDIIFKGGNLLNYERKQAAVCIGAPDGGTTYRLLPYVGAEKAELIIPIGLEKETSANLRDYEKALDNKNQKLNFVPKLHLYKEGTIFTEIEALKQFANVKAFPYGVGGVANREGGVSLVIVGVKSEVEKILSLVKSIQGEKPFGE